ncbi:MAG: hypothetical protein KKF22_03585 [Gammaproteobacteria bacterium]|nr:hypothetical protein [Gammaproteobacteria bacterium]
MFPEDVARFTLFELVPTELLFSVIPEFALMVTAELVVRIMSPLTKVTGALQKNSLPLKVHSLFHVVQVPLAFKAGRLSLLSKLRVAEKACV